MKLQGEDLRRFLRRTRCPRAFAELELDAMVAEGPYRDALDRARAVAGEFGARPVFLHLTGPVGTGKTRVACWLLRRAYESMLPIAVPGTAPLFVRAVDLVELRFRRQYGEESEGDERADVLRDLLDSTALLVVDDVSRVSGYRGEELYVERVVERRWEDLRSTVLTSNVGQVTSPRFADFLTYFEELPLIGRSMRCGA